MSNKRISHNGFTLVEILVATLVFALTIITISDFYGKTTQQIRLTREYIYAHVIAVELVDQICCMPFKKVPVLSERPVDDGLDGSLLVQGSVATRLVLSRLPEGFSRQLSITEITPGLKRIDVKVFWGKGARHSFSSQALMEWQP